MGIDRRKNRSRFPILQSDMDGILVILDERKRVKIQKGELIGKMQHDISHELNGK